MLFAYKKMYSNDRIIIKATYFNTKLYDKFDRGRD